MAGSARHRRPAIPFSDVQQILKPGSVMRDNDADLLLDVSRMVWRRWAGLRPTGIDRTCLAWHQHYGARAQAVLLHGRGRHILPQAASRSLFRIIGRHDDRLDDKALRRAFRRQFAAWVARHARQLAQSQPGRGRPWLNVGHTGLNLPGLPEWVRAANLKPVLMLHDIIPITHPQYCREGEAERHAARVRTILEIAELIITNSQYTLDTLHDYAAAIGLAVPPAHPVWLGTPHLAHSGPRETGTGDAFVILGTIEGRKNHMLLLDVWERLVRERGAAAPRLVIIGRRGWACDDVIARLGSNAFGDRVIETGALDDASIARHLADARALLFPSFAEGYGLPLVEALDAGIPVIASDLQVFREIGQGVADLLPPDDVEGWVRAVIDYAQDNSAARAAQLRRIEAFRTPSWDDHFNAVDPLLAALRAIT
jgi:glycosyltransferase involved in cell wall biosynthesis